MNQSEISQDTYRQQLDAAMYLASLVSRPRDVESILNKIRAITSRIRPPKLPTAKDMAALEQAREQLEQYLVTKEPLRTFTAGSLRLRVEAHLYQGTSKRSLYLMLAAVYVLMAIAELLLYYLPFQIEPALRRQLVESNVFAMMPVGAALFFYTALKDFKAELRQAYRYISAGVIILGLTEIVQPVINILHWRESPYAVFASIGPMAFAFLLIYIGVRAFSRLLGVQTRWQHIRLLAIAVALLTLGVIIMPHAQVPGFPAVFFALLALLMVSLITLSLASSVVLLMSARQGAKAYLKPMRTLAYALLLAGFATLCNFAVRLAEGLGKPGWSLAVTISAFSLSAIMLLRSGYTFNRASRY